MYLLVIWNWIKNKKLNNLITFFFHLNPKWKLPHSCETSCLDELSHLIKHSLFYYYLMMWKVLNQHFSWENVLQLTCWLQLLTNCYLQTQKRDCKNYFREGIAVWYIWTAKIYGLFHLFKAFSNFYYCIFNKALSFFRDLLKIITERLK